MTYGRCSPIEGDLVAHRCPHRRGRLPRSQRRHPLRRPHGDHPLRQRGPRLPRRWRGLLEDRTTVLDIAAVDGLLTRGGTTLGSARVAPERLDAGIAHMKGVLAKHGIDVLIPIGGEGTLTAAHLLSQAGVPV